MNDNCIAEYERATGLYWLPAEPVPELQQGFVLGYKTAIEHKQREIDALKAWVAKLESGLLNAIRYAQDCMKLLGEVDGAILKGDEDDEDDEQPNEITIGSEAARILRKYDDAVGDSLQEAKDET